VEPTRFGDLERRRVSRRFEADCERLRPLGEAYVLRRFRGSLNRADAEDAVSDVLLRLHRLHTEGRPPRNLRATFFTSVRNAAIDQLRSRGAKPTVGLEVLMERPADGESPGDYAESREDVARMQEALARMRPRYREAVLLRYGIGLTVPEIAKHKGMTVTAAKKLVVRATAQAKDRVLEVTSPEHCDELQRFAREGVIERQLSGADQDGVALFEKHVAHCGHCRRFLSELNGALHDLGSGALVSTVTADQLTGTTGIADQIVQLPHGVAEGIGSASEKVRLAGFKVTNALQGSDAAAGGALAGTGQKIAAVCATGATAATCVAVGAVPGVSVGDSPPDPVAAPAPVVEAPAEAPTPPTPADSTLSDTQSPTAANPQDTTAANSQENSKPSGQVSSEVGFEAPATAPSSTASGSEFGGAPSGAGGSSAGGGGGEFGGP